MTWICLAMLLSTAQAEPPDALPIIEGPSVVEHVTAPYPEGAQEKGLEGTVVLLVEIDEEGRVVQVQVVEGLGHGFDEAAVEATEQMRFAPARTAEGPVPVAFEFAYGFELAEEPEPEPQVVPASLDGTVQQMGTRRPVSGARVVVIDADEVAVTDERGRFALDELPPGRHQVRILHPEHVTLEREIDLHEGERTEASWWLRAERYRAHEALGLYRPEQEELTRHTVSIEEVKQVPGTFGDPVRVVQTLPGAARSPMGTGFLVIRGSHPDDTAVYVDGVRIPLIYHVTGHTSVIAPDLIESVDYLPGGYGVEYGRSMGGVVDVATRTDLDENRFTWSSNALDSRLYYEGRVGRNQHHGVAIGARHSYLDQWLPYFLDDAYTIQPRYWDTQLKWTPDLGEARSLSVFFYGFRDLLAVRTPDDVAQGADRDTQGDFRTIYASQRAALRYRQQLTDTLALDLRPSVGMDAGTVAMGDGFVVDSKMWMPQLRAELPWSLSPAIELIPGMDFIGAWWAVDFRSPFRWVDLQDPLAEREAVAFDGRGTGFNPDLYLKAHLRPLGDRERWLLIPGVRASTLHVGYEGSIAPKERGRHGIHAVDPRILTRYRLLEDTWLKGSTGLYHQPPQPQELVGIGTQAQTDYQRAWASSVGLEQAFPVGLHLDLELFYKRMDDLVVFNRDWVGHGDVAFQNEGRGRAYGLEIIARRPPVDRYFGWISYTLSRSERQDRPGENWRPFGFDQPHILSAQGGVELPRGFSVGGQVQYVTGNPTTPYDSGIYDVDADSTHPFRLGGRNAERMPPYFQTSVRLDRLWTFRTWQLLTYLDLLHVVRGVNPEFVVYNHDYTDHAYVQGLPFIPNLGIEARF